MLTIFFLLLTFQAIPYLMKSLEREFCSFKLQSSNSRLLKKILVTERVRAGLTGPSLILQTKIVEDMPRVTRRQRIRSEHKHTDFSKGAISHTLTLSL